MVFSSYSFIFVFLPVAVTGSYLIARLGTTPAAAFTAYAGSEDRLRALAAGFQIHVAKPVQPAELVAVVSSLARGPVP